MIETYVILGLATLNVVQFCFWSFQVHKLVNKLMSKNFAEYNSVVTPPTTMNAKLFDEEHLGEDHALKELNALIS